MSKQFSHCSHIEIGRNGRCLICGGPSPALIAAVRAALEAAAKVAEPQDATCPCGECNGLRSVQAAIRALDPATILSSLEK